PRLWLQPFRTVHLVLPSFGGDHFAGSPHMVEGKPVSRVRCTCDPPENRCGRVGGHAAPSDGPVRNGSPHADGPVLAFRRAAAADGEEAMMMKDFKQFLLRGNVVDLAVGIVI